jgi:pimeloyl-ACP methyl ester carboxylesterase
VTECLPFPGSSHWLPFSPPKGYWVFYPRYRGAWESGGQFLARSPHEDILLIIDELHKGVTELAFGKHFPLKSDQIFVIGGSFGGAVALLASRDSRVKKVVTNCPVVDWSILSQEERLETSNPSYAAYIREAFGSGYRLSDRNWRRLRGGTFFNPAHHIHELTPSKIMTSADTGRQLENSLPPENTTRKSDNLG